MPIAHPAPASSGRGSSGNAITDANAGSPPPGTKYAVTGPQGARQSAAIANALNQVNAANANLASDCLWPPSGQISIPIIPGVYTQSFNIPCLFTYSEARAVAGAGLLGIGLLIMAVGLNIIAFVEVGEPLIRKAAAATPEGAAVRTAASPPPAPSPSGRAPRQARAGGSMGPPRSAPPEPRPTRYPRPRQGGRTQQGSKRSQREMATAS